MRDRLCHLQTIAEEESSEEEWNPSSHEEDEDLDQEAVIFEEESTTMNDILKESQSLRKEITLLRLDVERLQKEGSRFCQSVRRLSGIQRDTNTISSAIRVRGEAILGRIQKLGKLKEELEESHGKNAAVVRVAQAQYVTLSHSFHEVMTNYNAAELEEREKCRERIQRQAEILKKEVTVDQIDQIIQEGGWGAFSEELQTDGRSSRWALNQIKERHKELLKLEARLKEVHELFQDMAMLVEEQGAMLNNIEANVVATDDYLGKVNEQFKTAIKYRKKNPCFQMFCGCFPCWKQATG
ncbi:syntaxin-11-like [Chanos chanos]|uniref:Syntaxin-11-like n=1 Tax=Chanos chanos TaxID=29144 RepID=A0A6J2V893_CHACN|nr:syntaxin-11-like [Chanos chanos]